MIDPKELLRLRRQRPFQPLRVHLQDGRALDVRAPEMLMIGRTIVHIGIMSPEALLPIADYVETMPLASIVRVEASGVEALRA
jgi:hypothetical protein